MERALLSNLEYFTSFDGKRIAYKKWVAPQCELGRNILAMHGLGSYVESFEHLGTFLSEHGSNVFAIEMRGFGHWPYENKWGYADLEHITRDMQYFITHVIKREYPRFTLVLLGDSLGCLLASEYLRSYPSTFEAVILSSPFFLAGYLRLAVYPLMLLNVIAPKCRIQIVRDLSKLTNDIEYVDFDTKLGIGAKWFTSELLYRVLRLSDSTVKYLLTEGLQCPLLITIGQRDIVANEKVIQKIVPKIKAKPLMYKVYQDGHHLLINDLEQQKVFTDMLDFMKLDFTPRQSFIV